MKSILLTTTALIAVAGASFADGHTGVTFTGNTEFGYNSWKDEDKGEVVGDEFGFYLNTDLDVLGTAALDNGITASAGFEIDVVSDATFGDLSADEFIATLATETASVSIGDQDFAAESHWAAAGDMESDGFSNNDGEGSFRADMSFGSVDTSISAVFADAAGGLAREDDTFKEEYDQLSFGVSGDFGMFSFAAAYQEKSSDNGVTTIADVTDYDPSGQNDDFTLNEVYGVSAGVSVAGADITLAYAKISDVADEDETSTGIQVAYPFGPVTATVYYVSEDDAANEDNFGATIAYASGPVTVTLDYDNDQKVQKVALDGTYDLGNGLTILAGVYEQSDDDGTTTVNGEVYDNEGTDYYVAAVYDLGSGAEVLVSYAEADAGGTISDDEVGGPDYQAGTTVEVSFSF